MSRRRTSFGIRCWQAVGLAVLVLGGFWLLGYAAAHVATAVGGR